MRRKDHLRQSATSLIYLVALAAVVTALIGLLAADTIGHDRPGHFAGRECRLGVNSGNLFGGLGREWLHSTITDH